MPAQDPQFRTYCHPIPEGITDRVPGLPGDGDALRIAVENRALIEEFGGTINRLFVTIDELRAEVAELKAANADAREEGQRSVLDGTAEAARRLVESARREVTMDDPPTPPELVEACLGTRRGRRQDVTVDVDGTDVTTSVTSGVTDPHEEWRDLRTKYGRRV